MKEEWQIEGGTEEELGKGERGTWASSGSLRLVPLFGFTLPGPLLAVHTCSGKDRARWAALPAFVLSISSLRTSRSLLPARIHSQETGSESSWCSVGSVAVACAALPATPASIAVFGLGILNRFWVSGINPLSGYNPYWSILCLHLCSCRTLICNFLVLWNEFSRINCELEPLQFFWKSLCWIVLVSSLSVIIYHWSHLDL